VFSQTFTAPVTARTRLETLATGALETGLVDEIRVFLCPLVVGAGLAALPEGQRIALDLLEERRLRAGFVYVRYGVRL
jgi:riboflavin biosynthesis pyrimidine reductase